MAPLLTRRAALQALGGVLATLFLGKQTQAAPAPSGIPRATINGPVPEALNERVRFAPAADARAQGGYAFAPEVVVGIDPGFDGPDAIQLFERGAQGLRYRTVPTFSESTWVCNICGRDLYDMSDWDNFCPHIPGVTYEHTVCVATCTHARLAEVSLVSIPEGMTDDEARSYGMHPIQNMDFHVTPKIPDDLLLGTDRAYLNGLWNRHLSGTMSFDDINPAFLQMLRLAEP